MPLLLLCKSSVIDIGRGKRYTGDTTMFKAEIEKLIKKAIKQEFGLKLKDIAIEKPQDQSFGDYAANVALIMSKPLKVRPKDIALKIKKAIKSFHSTLLDKVEIAGPGFINFFLSDKSLMTELNKVLREKAKYGSSKIGKGKTLVIDYSSPNIAKFFGIGHLRSTIIGQSIYNLYQFLGWRCIGDNHLGDWGTQFGKVIYQFKKNKFDIKKINIEDLERAYIDFHKQILEKPAIEKKARAWFKKLEQGDKEARKIWQACRDLSLKEFKKIYDLLGIKIDYTLGESFYEKMLKEIIDEAIKKKIVIKSQGALIVKYPNEKIPPAMLLKSDGATTYLTRDLATIKYRLKKWKPDLVVYEVGAEQKLHFQQLFWLVEILGWAKRNNFCHLIHGLIRFKHGKISTRSGRTIRLKQVLEQAIEKAKKIIDKSGTSRSLSEKEKQQVAKEVGIGAIKYNDLSHHCSKDIIFKWDKILNLKGNSGPYLQYTYARCQSVLKKGNFKPFLTRLNSKIKIKISKEEKDILRIIARFSENVEDSAKTFSPNLICNFAFDLAKKYNLFYNNKSIIKAKNPKMKRFRLVLTFSVAQILKNSLSLLGISTPKKM